MQEQGIIFDSIESLDLSEVEKVQIRNYRKYRKTMNTPYSTSIQMNRNTFNAIENDCIPRIETVAMLEKEDNNNPLIRKILESSKEFCSDIKTECNGHVM